MLFAAETVQDRGWLSRAHADRGTVGVRSACDPNGAETASAPLRDWR